MKNIKPDLIERLSNLEKITDSDYGFCGESQEIYDK